jgi:hypothetical protein
MERGVSMKDISLIPLKFVQKKTSVVIIAVSCFLIGALAWNVTSAQERMKEMPRKEKRSSSQPKKSEGSRERNPFLFPPGVYLLSKGGPPISIQKEESPKPDIKPPERDPQRVRAILISDSIRLATIGRHIVTVGDTIDDEKIVDIKADRVILTKGDRKRVLHLYQSPIQLTTEEK